MKSKRSGLPMRLFGLAALGLLSLGVSLPLPAKTYAYVNRHTPERQGRAWVEEADCAASVEEGGRLAVRADVGSVKVRPGAPDRMECRVRLKVFTSSEEEARRLLNQFELSVRRTTGGGVSLSGEFTGERRRSVAWSVEYDIQVPLRFNVDLETKGGSVEVERLDGELRAATAGGDIRVGDLSGPVRAETAGGNIELGNINQRVEARTAGGGIHVGDVKGNAILQTSGGEILAGRIEGGVVAETAGGDIVLRGVGADVVAETAGGQIRIGETGGSVRAETAGGSIGLDAARGPIRVQTAGGSIDLYGVQSAVRATTAAGKILAQIAASRESFAESALENAFGDVEVYLPPDLPLTIEATIEQASGHKIVTDFPLEIEGGELAFQPSTVRGRGALNGGGVLLRIHTVAGNIEIHKLSPASLERLQQRQNSVWQRWQELQRKREERQRLREQEREKPKEGKPAKPAEPPAPPF